MAAKLEELPKAALTSITSVSTRLRDAIAAALPIAPEQYLTVTIPGTVIDLTDSDKGGPFLYDDSKHSFPPTIVRQSEARLVDGMMPIAEITIGNKRRSVSRSYSRAIDALIPASPTFSPNGGIPRHGKMDYAKSMVFLKQQAPGTTKTIAEVYYEKEMKWAKLQQEWEEAKIKAAKDAEDAFRKGTEDYIEKRRKCFDDWTKTKGQSYRSVVQAAWMDWVVSGKKVEVEFAFGVGQMDSIARVEASKESMRNSAIDDISGDGEVYGVSQSPHQWATYCKRKVEEWSGRSDNKETPANSGTWSKITLSYSRSDIQTHESEPIGFGLWSSDGAESDEATKREMAACDVNISFSALEVIIDRPWLHGELFSDPELQVPRGDKLSPGPSRLHEMVNGQQAGETDQWTFPAYPTSFIVAANTALEIIGETKAIEEFWKSDGPTVGYGPWSVSGVNAVEQIKVEHTATGCKISLGAPQIIGWVSQIVPALPRS
ncbi:hypothetical protein IL306_009002 [Fusarium sp. DS 682]|nr:hypothetical protein IL306_009002 [Fusarium sp. DS 682]